MNDTDRLEAISMAIYLRDNSETIPEDRLPSLIFDLSDYGVFSNRQIANLLNNRFNHSKIKKFTGKSQKTGGRLSPESLEDIREVLFSKNRNQIDYEAVSRAVKAGTSQSMITKLSGVSQSSISRRLTSGNNK